MFKFRFVAIPLTGLSILAIGANVFAQSGSVLKFVVGSSSFVSPLIELYGDVSVGEKSFIASNTVLNAQPGTKIW